MNKTPLSVILMVHNEEETISDEIKKYYREIVKKIPNSELIIAEDGSTDRTREIILGLAKRLAIVPLVTAQKRGYSKSLWMAFKTAKGQSVFYADAGGKHDPKDYWKLEQKIDNYDLVTGFKKTRNDPWFRLLLAWGLNTLINIYFSVHFSDIDCGFKLMKNKVKNYLLQNSWLLKNNISLELVLRVVAGKFRVYEVPIKHYARKTGPSRGLPFKKIPRAILNILLVLPKLKKTLRQSR